MQVKNEEHLKSFSHIQGDVTILAGDQGVNEPVRIEAQGVRADPTIYFRVGSNYVRLLEYQLDSVIDGLIELRRVIGTTRAAAEAAEESMVASHAS